MSGDVDRVALADLWTRVERFCTEQGWTAELYVCEDLDQFGRIGVRVLQGGGYFFSAFGNTSNEAIRGIAKQLERSGFDA